MTDRRRGESTKERILEEACKVFAEKGFRDATHAEICGRAGANTAAVNYYFISKEGLYRAAFVRLAEDVERVHPLDGGLPATAPPERRLHALIHAHLSRMFDPALMGDFHRVRMAEMFDRTGLLDDLLAFHLAKDRELLQKILRDLLGPEARLRDVLWCEMSVVGQCFIGGPGPDLKPGFKPPPDGGPRVIFGIEAGNVDELAEHIMRFSLAGIRAIAERAADASSEGETPAGAKKRKPGRNDEHVQE